MRVNKGQELVIGGHIPASDNFDAILIGYYEGRTCCMRAKFGPDSYLLPGRNFSSYFADLSARPAHSQTYPKAGKVDGAKG
jgi:hypothetical protein